MSIVREKRWVEFKSYRKQIVGSGKTRLGPCKFFGVTIVSALCWPIRGCRTGECQSGWFEPSRCAKQPFYLQVATLVWSYNQYILANLHTSNRCGTKFHEQKQIHHSKSWAWSNFGPMWILIVCYCRVVILELFY